MTDYTRLMSAIIKKEMSIMGKDFALKVARNVPGLVIDDAGNVKSVGTKAQLRLLVAQYKSVSGGLAVMFAKKAIEPLLSGDEDLPDELKE